MIRSWCFLLLIFGLAPVRAWEPAIVDVTQQAAPPETDSMDHLEPADIQVPTEYYLIRFTAGGGLEPQDDVLTLTRREYDNKFILERRTIWVGGRPVEGMRLPPPVKMEVPEDLAALAYGMWVNALYEVRYDRNCEPEINDASTDLFSVYIRNKGWLAGTAQMPSRDLPPKWMEQAAEALVQLTADRNVAACRTRLSGLHDKLFAYWHEHGVSRALIK
jgi:hypothetical protein